ncbi:MAG: toxic anion resistance protein [Sphingomonas sp.]
MATQTETTTATETEAASTLTLDPPKPLQSVEPGQAAGLVPLKEEQKTELEAKVDGFVDQLVALDANSPDFGKKVDQLTTMGRKEIMEAAGHSNRFLDRPVKAIDADTGIGANLTELRKTVESLDPGRGVKPRKLFGFIPWGNSLRGYFMKYQSSQTHIASILNALGSGKDELLKDNAAIDVERANMWKTMGKLEQMIHISKTLDSKLEDKANELDATDPAKAKAIRETALFYTRQRTTDLLTQMAVTVQGYLALDLVKKNNVELVKGVDRASTTTVSALRTAVTVAQALTNQRLVLEQITALNTTTAGMIERTGELLKSQTGEIHKQAASSTIPLETLQRAFQNIYDTMDTIDRFKIEALGNMKQTVETLGREVEKSRGYIARAEGVEQNRQIGTSADNPLSAIEG